MAAVDLVRGRADRQTAPGLRRQLPGHGPPAREEIATTAVARKLLTRAWHLLTDAERAASTTTTTPAPASQAGAVTSREGSPGPRVSSQIRMAGQPRSMT